ncbi:thioredoxin [Salinarchaeum sp. Harcht-Bsk1]|uniref:DsbA family protein n=1 Tax=Salinarchaeum sp. Harcht-Bsk1 TaxID=1333523 RepID=UPI0003422FD8|nr:thioredoxin domain-containing protein [Salinarchaeum sp. Harcht-Bsk1]AGN01823.1 thioredoxin [Salinarchaeum sp. Harcht-Bsk1]
MRRRSVLAGIAGAASLGTATSLAGCLDTGSGGSGGQPLSEHPASRNLDGQPSLGDVPTAAEKVIVAFEDPTCSNCERFHTGSFQAVKREILEPESAAYVYRPYRYTGRGWATPAIHATLEVTAREPPVAWDLLDFYYENTYSISGGTFADETRSFLSENTDLDADTILAAAENRAHQSVLETAEADGDEAGVNSTPTFFLYKNERFKNKLVGVQDVTAFQAGFEV